jgi:hypothetical protein
MTTDIQTFARTFDDPAPGTGNGVSRKPVSFLRLRRNQVKIAARTPCVPDV